MKELLAVSETTIHYQNIIFLQPSFNTINVSVKDMFSDSSNIIL